MVKHLSLNLTFLFLFLITGCSTGNAHNEQDQEGYAQLPTDVDGLEVATLAGGCFWCTEAVFERVKGVKYVVSGYAGGEEKRPTYSDVSYGKTSHAEAIQIYYDPNVVDFETLLEVFFRGAHDPTQINRQGPDVGTQYRSVAFYRTPKEKQAIETKIEELEKANVYSKPIATQIVPLSEFYPAEKYHQDYYADPANLRNPYVQNVTKPKVDKFEEKFPELLKETYTE